MSKRKGGKEKDIVSQHTSERERERERERENRNSNFEKQKFATVKWNLD